jgi:NifU-like protein involved in Fe-S cluster formation
MEYSSEVQRRLSSPSRSGLRQEASGELISSDAEDRTLNVWVRFQVELVRQVIRSVRFEAYGCPHFVAAADWMSERLDGQPARALSEPAAQAARAALDVPTEKLGKLLVLEDALAACRRAADRAGSSSQLRPHATAGRDD